MPAMTHEQEASWRGLLDLSQRLPDGWTLVGGQMVQIHCAEFGHVPRRPNLVRALIAKAAAHTVPADHHKGRHRSDFATLAAMVSRRI